MVRALTRASAARAGWPQASLLDRPRAAQNEPWRNEAREIVTRTANATWLAPRQRELLALSLAIGPTEANLDALAELERHASQDPTGRLADLLEIERLAIRPAEAPDRPLAVRRTALLLFVARRYAAARMSGAEPAEALTVAGIDAGDALDPATAQALSGALSEYV
jgi:hypothetical protein